MFYSHEILTSRKYGVATVWIVATLGAKSTSKKLTRKAIVDVDVAQACSTIMEPDAPMALRLQSNLMYGVARVFSQQCGYVLSDAQAAQTALRALRKGKSAAEARDLNVDGAAGRARRELLVLPDDPAFLLDMALPPLELDVSDWAGKGDSQMSLLSVRGRSNSSRSNSLPRMDLGSSSGNSIAYQLPFNDPFAGSAGKTYTGSGGDPFGEEELQNIEAVFEIDAEGNIVDIPESVRAARRSSAHPQASRLGSDSAASGRVRRDHEEAAARDHGPRLIDEDGDYQMIYGDDENILPDAEAFPTDGAAGVFMSGGLQGNDQPISAHANLQDRVHADESHVPSSSSEGSSSVSAEAPLRPARKARGPRKLPLDHRTMLTGQDLKAFQNDYLDNMAATSLVKEKHRAVIQARKLAFEYIYGTGLMGVGDGLGAGSLKFANPLAAFFSGDALLEAITGQPVSSSPGKRKRDKASSPTSTPKRLRNNESELGRGLAHKGDEDPQFVLGDDEPLPNPEQEHEHSIEIGRRAGSALADYPSSAALMPWNISASLRGSKAGSKRIMTSASPLIGRGSALPGDLERFNLSQEGLAFGDGDEDDYQNIYGQGRSLSLSSRIPRGARSSQAPSSSHAHDFDAASRGEEYDIFGPAAAIDTQTAASSQWVRQALDRESDNFFEYVKNTIAEKTPDELELGNDEEIDIGAEGEGEDGKRKGRLGEVHVTFEELFECERNSAVVAAQAFYHVLCLATKGKVWVEQDDGEQGIEIGGEMRIGVVEVV